MVNVKFEQMHPAFLGQQFAVSKLARCLELCFTFTVVRAAITFTSLHTQRDSVVLVLCSAEALSVERRETGEPRIPKLATNPTQTNFRMKFFLLQAFSLLKGRCI